MRAHPDRKAKNLEQACRCRGPVAKLDALVEDSRRLPVSAVSVTEVAGGTGDDDRRAAFDDVLARPGVILYDRDAAD